MTKAQMQDELKKRNWFVDRNPYRNWRWCVYRTEFSAIGEKQIILCESNGHRTRLAAVENAIERGFGDGVAW